jgi:hypothetical protein
MSTLILTDAMILLAGYDLSGDMNSVSIESGIETKDNTTFGDDTRSMQGGLKTSGVSAEGFWNGGTGEVDDILFNGMGLDGKIIMISPTGVESDIAYSINSMVGKYSPGGAVGEMFKFSVDAAAQGDLIRGTLIFNAASLSSSGNGTGYQLGAVGASETLYGVLQVLNAGTGTIDIIVESDIDNTFTTAATQLTFTQFADVGAEIQTKAGAITDDWYRVSYTIAGASPDFQFALALGIQ